MAMIYALKDDAGQVRYVGKANDAEKRLASHFRDSNRRKTPVYNWFKKCIARGFTPIIEILETCEGDWKERERFWIAHYRALGPLLNVADGGDEPFCSLETRQNNARKVTKSRAEDPLKARIYKLKRDMCRALQQGYVKEETKAKLRIAVEKRPDLWGALAKWL